MKGVVLGGGTGSRLWPLTKVTSKHLLPVGRYPMIYHPIAKLKEAGIEEIAIVTGPDHMGAIVQTLGSGRQWGLDFTYRVQDQAGGIAQALGLCETFAGEDPVCVVLGDNIFEDSLVDHVQYFTGLGRKYSCDSLILLQYVPDGFRFGVATFDEFGEITEIVEKPEGVTDAWAIAGVYIYDTRVFQMVKDLKPSGRGELEISDINSNYLLNGNLHHSCMQGWWTDAGTPVSYRLANELAKDIDLDGILRG